jgi:hypothetical protein
VSLDQIGTYDVLGGVYNDQIGSYSVIGPVVSDQLGAYGVFSAVERDQLGAYGVYEGITQDQNGAYVVEGPPTVADQIGSYGVFKAVFADQIGNYHVTMSIRTIKAKFRGKTVLLSIPDNSLVFDGREFVSPKKAKRVMLGLIGQANFMSPGPVTLDQFQSRHALIMRNYFLCTVLGTDVSSTGQPSDVITIPDPNDGICLCGVTCTGTNIQYVKVTYA